MRITLKAINDELARALGHRLSKDDVMRIWGWKNLTPR
jgi:hypothetical protein